MAAIRRIAHEFAQSLFQEENSISTGMNHKMPSDCHLAFTSFSASFNLIRSCEGI